MKTWLIALIGIVLSIYRRLLPSNKWVRKREQYRLELLRIDNELEKVTLQLVQAKKDNSLMVAAGLDMERERLLSARHDCKREYDYYQRLCDKER